MTGDDQVWGGPIELTGSDEKIAEFWRNVRAYHEAYQRREDARTLKLLAMCLRPRSAA